MLTLSNHKTKWNTYYLRIMVAFHVLLFSSGLRNIIMQKTNQSYSLFYILESTNYKRHILTFKLYTFLISKYDPLLKILNFKKCIILIFLHTFFFKLQFSSLSPF